VIATDRIKESLLALIRAAHPRIDYLGLYRAKVVKQSADQLRFDVIPDDKRLPGMSDVPLKLGIPGGKVKVSPGAFVLVAWEGGDPRRPYVTCWDGGETVVQLTLVAEKIELGAENLGLLPLVNGVVLASGIDPFTGSTYGALGSASQVITAKKA
jgi:hypothetical protein